MANNSLRKHSESDFLGIEVTYVITRTECKLWYHYRNCKSESDICFCLSQMRMNSLHIPFLQFLAQ